MTLWSRIHLPVKVVRPTTTTVMIVVELWWIRVSFDSELLSLQFSIQFKCEKMNKASIDF